MEQAVERKTYTVREASILTGVGVQALTRALARAEIPSIRIGKRILIPKEALDALLSGSAKAEGGPGATNG